MLLKCKQRENITSTKRIEVQGLDPHGFHFIFMPQTSKNQMS